MAADVFFSAGEASGDFLAATLAQALHERRPCLRLAGIGGRRLRNAGAVIAVDSSEWGSIGPVSALTKIPALYWVMRATDRALRRHPPGLLVAIDFGAFNLRLLAQMRRGGWAGTAIYYFPPGAWLDDAGQARAVAAAATPLVPFAHQRDFYRSLGLPVEFFGHPLVSLVHARPPTPIGDRPRIAVLPGSRREEVALHTPALAGAARLLAKRDGARTTVVAASPEREAQILESWRRSDGPEDVALVRADAGAALTDADVAWVASGTAVLEASLRGVPQIAFYKVSPVQYRIAQRRLRRFVRGPITLPNLVLGRAAVPELLQDELSAESLAGRTSALLQSEGERNRQLEDGAELRSVLGPPDALGRIAEFVSARVGAGNGGF